MLKLRLRKISLFVLVISGLNFLNYKAFATNQNKEDRLPPAYKEFFGIEDEKEKKELKKEIETKEKTKKIQNEIKNKEFENTNVAKQLKNNAKILERKKQTEKENQNLKILEDEKKKLEEKDKINTSLKNNEKKELKIDENKQKVKNEINITIKKKEPKEEEIKTFQKQNLELKNSNLQKNKNSTENKDVFIGEAEYLISALKRNQIQFENILNNIGKTTDKRILNLIFYDDSFKRREFYGTILNLIRREMKFSNLKLLVDENKDLVDEIFKKLAVLYNKNKDKVFLDPSKLGFYLDELVENFNLELKNILHNSVRFDKDFILRDSYLHNVVVPDYKVKKMVTKFMNRYYVYEEEETKMNVVLAIPGWDYKHVIFLKNPNKKTLKIAEELRNVKKIVEKDGIKFINDDINEDFIAKIYPCLKEQYYDEKDNILILIKDVLNSFCRKELDFDSQNENYKYTTILKLLKDNLFTKLYNDNYNDYPTKYNDEKKEENEKNEENSNNFEYLKEENKDFFKKDQEIYKYCAEVEYKLPKNFEAKGKDILDFDRDGLKNLLKNELEKHGYFNFDVDFDILKDSLKMKFFGNDEQDFKKEKFLNNLGEINEKLISEWDYDFNNSKNLTGFLLKCNSLNRPLKMYENIRTDKKKFEKFFRDNWELNRLRFYFTTNYEKSFHEGFDKNFAVASIDWVNEYRAKTPIWDLILKSFKERGELFSEKVFDIEDDVINDYVLRIYENLKNASVDLVNLFFYGKQNVTIRENLNYKESDY